MMHFVEAILEVRPYQLTLKFNTGEVRRVDLEPTLRGKSTLPGSAYERLLDPAVFIQVQFDRQSRTVYWEGLAREAQADGAEKPAPLDFCPDVLYDVGVPLTENETEGRVPV